MGREFLTEAAMQAWAKRDGWALRKSRTRLGLDNFGGYQIIDPEDNTVAAGSRYELELEDVADWLSR
jgi:hypothetical protein